MNDTPTPLTVPLTDAERGQAILVTMIEDTKKALKFREESAETWSKGSDKSWRAAGCRLTKAERLKTAASNRRIADRIKQQLADLESLERQIPRWLPIESAPRDGTEILVLGYCYGDPKQGTFQRVGTFDEETDSWYLAEYPGDESKQLLWLIAWMSLPEPQTL